MQKHIDDKYKEEDYLINTLNQSQLQLEYMSNTINDFTDFNQQAKHKETFSASSVFDSVRAIVDQTLEKNNIQFEMICHQDFSIVSYPRELSQVVLNLIQNAQDALLKRQVVHSAIKVIIDNNKISVQDNAGGIEAALIDRIFEPYFTTKSKTSSMGLGLYMCKIILEKHFSAKIEFEQIKQTTSFNIIFSA